jgi:pimeloyl-ACP methyl ester carboxylesterase
VVRAHLSPERMARRARFIETYKFSDPAGVRAPALVITGEDGLDRVVKPELTRQYVTHLPNARSTTLPRTGHLGLVTRPAEYARLVCQFVDEITDNAKRIPA